MTRPATRSEPGGGLLRFTVPVRWVHATFGALMLVCLVTAAILYNGSLEVLVGDRYVVERVHVVCGFALPVPLLVGLLSGSYRADLRRLNRFGPRDRQWLRSRSRRDGSIPVGKFNAGQKLNAALSAGAVAVLLGSGTIMYVTGLLPLAYRTGATFVHDWVSLAVGLLVLGHVVHALQDPVSMRGIRSGTVPLGWARRHHAGWAEELTGSARPDPPKPSG